VFVTNKVRETKAVKIFRHRAWALEVDVRELRHEFDRSVIHREVFEETIRKRWLYAPEFEQDQLPPPKPIYVPLRPPPVPPDPVETLEEEARRLQRAAEFASTYKPPTPYVVPRRLSDKIRAQLFGQEPAPCGICGALTTKWVRIDCETGECVCRECTAR